MQLKSTERNGPSTLISPIYTISCRVTIREVSHCFLIVPSGFHFSLSRNEDQHACAADFIAKPGSARFAIHASLRADINAGETLYQASLKSKSYLSSRRAGGDKAGKVLAFIHSAVANRERTRDRVEKHARPMQSNAKSGIVCVTMRNGNRANRPRVIVLVCIRAPGYRRL